MATKIAIGLMMLAAGLLADDEGASRDFGVTFSDCTEFVGFGPVPLAQAQPFVPAAFQITPVAPGVAGVVVRAANCASVTVDGRAEGPGTVAHMGVNIVSPDNSGDINNYTVLYLTSSDRLAQRLRRAGLPATYDRGLLYEYTRGVPATSGELYVAAKPDGAPAYFLSGTETDPPAGGFPFLANWWFKGERGVIKMSTNIPLINFGAANVRLATGRSSDLGRLIGGNSYANFSILAVRGAFALGQMQTTVR